MPEPPAQIPGQTRSLRCCCGVKISLRYTAPCDPSGPGAVIAARTWARGSACDFDGRAVFVAPALAAPRQPVPPSRIAARERRLGSPVRARRQVTGKVDAAQKLASPPMLGITMGPSSSGSQPLTIEHSYCSVSFPAVALSTSIVREIHRPSR